MRVTLKMRQAVKSVYRLSLKNRLPTEEEVLEVIQSIEARWYVVKHGGYDLDDLSQRVKSSLEVAGYRFNH